MQGAAAPRTPRFEEGNKALYRVAAKATDLQQGNIMQTVLQKNGRGSLLESNPGLADLQLSSRLSNTVTATEREKMT